MRKDFSTGFGVANSVVFRNEVIGGFNFHVDSETTVPGLAAIADLNKVGIDIILTRDGYEPTTMFSGYLDDLLSAMYAQTTKFDSMRTARGFTYDFLIDFGGICNLVGKDTLEVKFKADVQAFTTLSKTNSSIFVESIPAFGVGTMLPVIRSYPFGVSETNFDKKLSGAVSKIVLVTDLTTDYLASSKAKLSTLNIISDGYDSTLSEETLFKVNAEYLVDNPSNKVKNLVAYWGDMLTNVKLKSKLTAGADASTKILAVEWQNI